MLAFVRALLLGGLIDTATLWVQAGMEAGILWPVLVMDTFNKVHAAMAQSQLNVLLRQMENGDSVARRALADWTASTSEAICFLDSAIRDQIPMEQ